MLNDWFLDLTLKMSWDEFQLLPRHPAFRYEYRSDQCQISSRPIYYHARLSIQQSLFNQTADSSLSCFEICEDLTEEDWNDAAVLFGAAFSRSPPLFQHSSEFRQIAAARILKRTRTGQDGPWVAGASWVIREARGGKILGVSLVTLLPSDDLSGFRDHAWNIDAPSNAVEMGWGFPHLTWIFVDPRFSRNGLGQALLLKTAESLQHLGYTTLFSTFLLGNDASLLWHWKMGFKLLSHVSSR